MRLLPAGRVAAALGGVVLALPLPGHPAEGHRFTPRQETLVAMVRQDCGSCHGMRLTGGLGPPLTREALAGMPAESLAATIVHGRPGTAMPGWRAMLDDTEARWIAEQLLRGFPEERRTAR